MASSNKPPAPRFGIGEWYGHLLPHLTPQERKRLGVRHDAKERIPCPFKPLVGSAAQPCHKAGGVCSLLQYAAGDNGLGIPVEGAGGSLRTLCPSRFREDQIVERWIARELLDTDEPLAVGEVGFLRSEGAGQLSDEPDPPVADETENVGRIDSVLMHPDLDRFRWCAVEVQAVYFSGNEMPSELKLAASFAGNGPPFPAKTRRPDYRSSGPKRLMPQLQIKVPTLRRWGKKMAVVIDEAFFSALGTMDDVKDPSNADIGWFVVRFVEDGRSARLEPAFVRYTTLERAVEGLTAGRPVTLNEFEERIKNKLLYQQKARSRLRQS
ncbi:MAG: NotI family restriction endonuclease [Fimbriimonadaceae bacterium]